MLRCERDNSFNDFEYNFLIVSISDVCAALLHIGADVTAKDTNHRTALHYAAEAGKARTVEALLSVSSFASELEAQDHDNETSLHLASRNGHVEVIKLLLRKGADVTVLNIKGMTSLDIAIQNRRSEVAQCFVLHDRYIYKILCFLKKEKALPYMDYEGIHHFMGCGLWDIVLRKFFLSLNVLLKERVYFLAKRMR